MTQTRTTEQDYIAAAIAEARRIHGWTGRRVRASGQLRDWTVRRTTGTPGLSGYFRVYLIEPDGSLNSYDSAFHVAVS